MTNGPEAPELGGPTGPGAQVGQGRAAKEPVTRAGQGIEALGQDIVEEIDKGVEELEEEISSLRKVFAKRRLSVRTMGRPLRLATVGAGASLFASVMLMALRGLGGTSVYLGTQDGAVTTVAQPIFIASLVLVSIGFGYVLTAATLAGPWLAATTLTGLVFLVGLYTGAFGQLVGGLNLFSIMPRWAHWSGRALLAAIVLLAIGGRLAIKLHDKNPDLRHERLEHHHLVPAMIVAFSILVGGYLTVIAVAMPTIGNLNLYGETIYIIFGSLAWLMWPILLVAAVDFGEWGQITGNASPTPSLRAARPCSSG